MKNIKYFLPLLLSLLFGSSLAAVSHPAYQRVENSVNGIFNILQKESERLKAEPGYQKEIVAKYVTPYLDFVGMTKLAVGKNWRKGSDQQKQKLVEEFKILLLRTYTKALAEYSDQAIKFKPFRPGKRADRAIVYADILQVNGPLIPMKFRLRQVKEQWLVYDIAIDGISLVTTYRSSFTSQIKSSGIDGLIVSLTKKNNG